MGISVKSRSRNTGTEGTYVSIPNDNLVKLELGCRAFDCQPYFAVVVDEADTITVFILSKSHLVKLLPPGEKVISWKKRDRKSTRLNSSHIQKSRMPSSA